MLSLDEWEDRLDESNKACSLSPKDINKVLKLDSVSEELTPLNYSDNIAYYSAKSTVSLRSLNGAHVWSGILEYLKFDGQDVCELCPGNCNVIDMALTLRGYRGQLTKVDYCDLKNPGLNLIKTIFERRSKNVDVINDPGKIPKSDLIVMNHAIDDLFIGLWANDSDIDYFGERMFDIRSSIACWEDAIKNNSKYTNQMVRFISAVCERVRPGGYLIITNYPSSFETRYKLEDRIKFTQRLCDLIVGQIKKIGMVEVPINLDGIEGVPGLKYPGSFNIFRAW